MIALIEQKKTGIADLCRQHEVRRLDLFGSAARGDFQPERSDLDFIVQFVRTGYAGYPIVVTAVPDPHVERWYLLDPLALSKAAGISRMPVLPAHKCDKDYYKHLLRSAFNNSHVIPLLGGAEYGPLVADEMDLYAASKADHGLAEFVGGVKSWLKQLP